MRLIDADKLVEICRKGWKLFGREDEKLKHWVDEDDIRNQPTVKAIPIEWFKKQIDWHSETLTYGAEVYQWVLNRWYEDKEKWEKEK